MLHVGDDEECGSKMVHPFTEQTWKTAGNISQARTQHQKRSKYLVICQSINFEAEPLPHYGYHSGCYYQFTAYQKQSKLKKAVTDKPVQTRSKVEGLTTEVISHTGVLEKQCIFCKGPYRKHFKTGFETLSSCETIQAQDSIITAARIIEDTQFLREYESIDFVAKEVKYHNTCRARYISKGNKLDTKEEAVIKAMRRETAFKRLIYHINSEICIKEK